MTSKQILRELFRMMNRVVSDSPHQGKQDSITLWITISSDMRTELNEFPAKTQEYMLYLQGGSQEFDKVIAVLSSAVVSDNA